MVLDSALLHDDICHMATRNFRINRNIAIINRAMPNVMIAFSTTDKCAAIFFQYIPDNSFIFSHYRHTFA